MMQHKPRGRGGGGGGGAAAAAEEAQRAVTMTEGGGKKKGEMMERGHAGSEWMYTCNAECECVSVCVSEGESGLSVKVKPLSTEDLCCRFKKETD